jgi:hypothetical protein
VDNEAVVAGRRRFLKFALIVVGGALAAVGLRRAGPITFLRSSFTRTFRPALDATAPTGPVPAPALTTLLSFAEVVVAGETIPGDGREALQAWVQESAAEQPGQRALCEAAAALLDRLAGGPFASLPVAERTALIEKHRLAEHPVGRLELLSPRNRVGFAVRDLLVPELIRVYYDSPSGWAEVGYRRPYGECGQGREYTKVPA